MRGAAVGSAELHDTRFVAQSVFDAGAQAEFGIGDKAGTLHVIAVRGLKGAASADDDDFGRDARNPEAATASVEFRIVRFGLHRLRDRARRQRQRRKPCDQANNARSEEHTSELESLMSISFAVFCVKKTKIRT